MIKIGARNTGYSINIFLKIIHTYKREKNLLQDFNVETAKDDANDGAAVLLLLVMMMMMMMM